MEPCAGIPANAAAAKIKKNTWAVLVIEDINIYVRPFDQKVSLELFDGEGQIPNLQL